LNPKSDDERELLRQVARGDPAAFSVLFDRHAAAAARYARRLVGDQGASEDAVHGAFVRLIEVARSGGIDPDRGSLRGLLFRTVRNLSIDWLRSRSRVVPLGDVDVGAASQGADVVRLELESALALLPENHRSALLLRVDGGLSYTEIAAVLGATLAQVKMWIFRARKALAERMLEPAKEAGRVV
jgi:RNA polymerase sigma-70 factor (ECF subfamily)